MIFKQKYMAAIEKVRKMQGQVEHLQEELQYSQQQVEFICMRLLRLSIQHLQTVYLCPIQLKESQSATRSVWEELAETAQWYRDKVTQWENSQEALDQLTDELEASQNLLMESQQKVNHLKGETETLQEQVDTLKQQVGTSTSIGTYELYTPNSQWPAILFGHILSKYLLLLHYCHGSEYMVMFLGIIHVYIILAHVT